MFAVIFCRILEHDNYDESLFQLLTHWLITVTVSVFNSTVHVVATDVTISDVRSAAVTLFIHRIG